MEEKTPGFTLIELLVVVAVMAILTSSIVAILNPTRIKRQARDSVRKSTLARVATGLSDFEVTHESFPQTLSQLVPNVLLAVPKSPLGEEFGYVAEKNSGEPCSVEAKDCEKSVLYDVYESPSGPCPSGTAFWVWTSLTGRLGKVCSTSAPTTDDVPGDD